jgi:hypothetical protein
MAVMVNSRSLKSYNYAISRGYGVNDTCIGWRNGSDYIGGSIDKSRCIVMAHKFRHSVLDQRNVLDRVI